MKFSLFILIFVVACAKEGPSKKSSRGPGPFKQPDPIVDITDPLEPGDPQQQIDDRPRPPRNYNGVNVVLNYRSNNNVGMIRIRGKDSEKLHKHMALSTIRLQSQYIKSDLEAKVGKHVMCRPDICWVYIDYKNGDVKENQDLSVESKAKKIFRSYRGQNLELQMINRAGKIFVEGKDAQALYAAMAVPEIPFGGKGSTGTRKSGDGLTCYRKIIESINESVTYRCEVKFNHRNGVVTGNHF